MIPIGKTDCKVDQLGTALRGCMVIMGQVLKFLLVERGTKLNIQNDTLDNDKISELIQSGKMIVLPNHLSIEDNTEDTVYTTLGSGVLLFVREGLTQLLVQYPASVCLGKALSQLSNRNWDLLLVDNSNKMFFEHTSNGYIKGFETSLVRSENMTFNDGANPAQKPLRIQLSPYGNEAFNESMDYYATNAIDWRSLEGVEDVSLEILFSTPTDLRLQVVNGCDKTTVIEGLDDLKYWKITNAATSQDVEPTGITYENGIYTISGVPAGDYLISLYDKEKGFGIISMGTNYYKTTENLPLSVKTE